MSRTAERARRQVDYLLSLLVDELTDTNIDELVRRGQHTTRADGWKNRTISDGGSHGNSELTSVENIANLRGFAGTDDDYFGRCTVTTPEPDPTGDAINQLFEALADMERLGRRLESKLTYIRHVRHAAAGRTNTTAGPCQCCGRDVAGTTIDRLRSGYCEACHSAWRRYLKKTDIPDRQQFERDRRAKLEADEAKRQAEATQGPTSSDTKSDTVRVNVGALAHRGHAVERLTKFAQEARG